MHRGISRNSRSGFLNDSRPNNSSNNDSSSKVAMAKGHCPRPVTCSRVDNKAEDPRNEITCRDPMDALFVARLGIWPEIVRRAGATDATDLGTWQVAAH